MFSFFKSVFSISIPVKITMVLCGVSAVFFAIGFALRPIADIVDELHDSPDTTKKKKNSTTGLSL